jgi:hypothetical protein
MEIPSSIATLPADYYRRHAARVRLLAREATTPGIKEHLQGVVREYEELAEKAEHANGRL